MLAPEYFERFEIQMKEKDKAIEIAQKDADQRFAKMIMQMDPLEPLMRKFNGIFTPEFTHPEDKLNESGQLGMKMWAYRQNTDPHFQWMIEWIMNSAGNETLKRAPITSERTQYGRAQISNMILFRDEVGRLSNLYLDELEKHKVQEFDGDAVVE